MLTKELQTTLTLAVSEAARRRHEYVTLEHLLFALIQEETASLTIRKCGGNLKQLEQELEDYFAQNLDARETKSNSALNRLTSMFVDPKTSPDDDLPEQSVAFQRVIERAVQQAQGSGQAEINSGNILAALFQETNSHAVYLLKRQGITRLDLLNYLSHGIAKSGDSGPARVGADEDDEDALLDPLKAFTLNLTERAAQGRIDPLIGRQKELERTIQVLCRRRKNNPIFVGDPGVGKTAIVEGLALKIFQGQVPEVLETAEIYSLDMGAILAGTKFRGEFEERLKAVSKAVKERPNAILFIDEIHTIVGAGSVSGGSMDASNILKPDLASGDLRCIGSTTYQEYKSSIERDRALARRFQKIEVGEPTLDETHQILIGLRKFYEEHHGIRYTDEALRAAVDLSAKHINDRFLPDKAIDVMDEAGAAVMLLPRDQRPTDITPHDIEVVVARMAKIPTKSVSASDKDRLKNLETDLKAVIFGQDKAIEQIVRVIKLSRSGLGAQDKPIGSFLFSGPTGVGKTELAKQLAVTLGVEFLRFDMSEYMEKHTVSRLIGAPPGYVGFDQGGLLTDAVTKTPYAVLVLDEIEKAHPDVYNILLQVMDHATLTDNNGKKADFRNIILIMTTNAGAREMSTESIGFQKTPPSAFGKEAIERTFTPEFRNRLSAWIPFSQLAPETIARVVDKFVNELRAQLVEKKVTIDLTDAGRAWLAEKGYDRLYGARPMGRLIQSKIREQLAEEVLFGKLEAGGIVTVDARDGELTLDITPLEAEV